MLCLKSGKCKRPCSKCDVRVEVCGALIALDARGPEVVAFLERHLETAGYRRRALHRQRRLTLEAMDSKNSFVQAFAGMAGLSTAPYLFYRMVGFDVLHVRLGRASSTTFSSSMAGHAAVSVPWRRKLFTNRFQRTSVLF